MNRIRTLAKTASLASAIAMALSGCFPTAANYTGASVIKRNQVELVRLTHPIRFDGTAGIDAIEAADLRAFVERHELGYGDSLALDMGAGVTADHRAAVAEQLRYYGLPLGQAVPMAGAVPDAGQAVLVVDRYIVAVPPCPNFGQETRRNYANAESISYGCADAQNLGHMIANPRDLIEGQDGGQSTARQATKGVAAHHKLPPTFLQGGGGAGGGGGGGGGAK